jgi:hypothetical protein
MATKEGTLKWFNEVTATGLSVLMMGGGISSCAAAPSSMGSLPSRRALR